MRTLLFVSLVSVAACATTVQPTPAGYPSSLAAQNDHDGHDKAERKLERHANDGNVGNACNDTTLNDQLTTGGLPVTQYSPCWDTADETEIDVVVANQPKRAPLPGTTVVPSRVDKPASGPAVAPPTPTAERQAVRALPETEIVACATIPVREREHSVFAHRRAIEEVQPYYEGGKLLGVRVAFKPVASLTADWMRQDIACHQAHVAVLGGIPDSMRQDPTLVLGATVTVSTENGHLSVLVRTDSPDQAALALAKAQGKAPSGSVALDDGLAR